MLGIETDIEKLKRQHEEEIKGDDKTGGQKRKKLGTREEMLQKQIKKMREHNMREEDIDEYIAHEREKEADMKILVKSREDLETKMHVLYKERNHRINLLKTSGGGAEVES